MYVRVGQCDEIYMFVSQCACAFVSLNRKKGERLEPRETFHDDTFVGTRGG